MDHDLQRRGQPTIFAQYHSENLAICAGDIGFLLAFEIISKKERLLIKREREKLGKHLSSIADLVRIPAALFIIDINKEKIAVAERSACGGIKPLTARSEPTPRMRAGISFGAARDDRAPMAGTVEVEANDAIACVHVYPPVALRMTAQRSRTSSA